MARAAVRIGAASSGAISGSCVGVAGADVF